MACIDSQSFLGHQGLILAETSGIQRAVSHSLKVFRDRDHLPGQGHHRRQKHIPGSTADTQCPH